MFKQIIFLNKAVLTFFMIIGTFFGAFGEATGDQPKFKPHIYIGFETGQIVKGRYMGETTRHLWLGNMVGRGGLCAKPSDWLSFQVDLEGRMWFNTFPNDKISDNIPGVSYYYSFYFHQAQGTFSLIRDKPVGLDISLGLFPYKYNDNVRDLGEYLFRSGTYPIYLNNNFDAPFERITGLRLGFSFDTPKEVLGSSLFGMDIDALLLTERQMRPFHDFTLAFIGSMDLFKAVEVGGGLSFAHLWPVDDSLTTVRRYETSYIVDSTDTGYYSFEGTKLMLRTTLDPVFFLRGKEGFLGDLFGDHGMKLYGELAIIGLKNYPASEVYNPYGYDKLDEKMPIMFGFNIPMWKILDIFAMEFEYFNCPYPNDIKLVYQFGQPLPVVPSGVEYDSTTYRKDDNWKWAIYMKKNIGKNCGLILQMCRDHQRWEVHPSHWRNNDFEEAMVKPKKDGEMGEWAWHFKVEYKF